jgi:hypothetical protein
MPGVGQIAKLVAGLISGEGNLIDKILASKLDQLGEGFLKKQLGGELDFGAGIGLPKFRSHNDFDKLRRAWFSQSTGPAFKGPEDLFEKIFSTMEAQDTRSSPGGGTGNTKRARARWTKTDWARSRSEWLDNKWKHDWRSQPRDAITGRWLPGRLDNIAATLRYQGSKAGRKTLRRRKQRRKARLSGRRAARKLFKSLKRK